MQQYLRSQGVCSRPPNPWHPAPHIREAGNPLFWQTFRPHRRRHLPHPPTLPWLQHHSRLCTTLLDWRSTTFHITQYPEWDTTAKPAAGAICQCRPPMHVRKASSGGPPRAHTRASVCARPSASAGAGASPIPWKDGLQTRLKQVWSFCPTTTCPQPVVPLVRPPNPGCGPPRPRWCGRQRAIHARAEVTDLAACDTHLPDQPRSPSPSPSPSLPGPHPLSPEGPPRPRLPKPHHPQPSGHHPGKTTLKTTFPPKKSPKF